MPFPKMSCTRWCGLILLCLITSLPVHGQVSGATVSGTVSDPSGAAIPKAQVVITNRATGVSRSAETNAVGFYAVPNLLPGGYEIAVSAAGFDTQTVRLDLTVGAQQALRHVMRIGAASQKVEVSASPSGVELASSALGSLVNDKTVRELPLNGRSWTDLATLQPGVAAIEAQPSYTTGPARGNRGFGAQMSISGARPQQNNYRLDGISINDYANGGPGSVIGGNLGVDAIQEFSVLTSNYSAEYGKTSGGVVNAMTRSGTNQIHGDVYEFIRNSALDARNFFDPKAPPPFRRNQFGAAGSGPIIKDRTFVFGDYEGIRQSLGITNVVTVPSPNARQGVLSTGRVTVDPAAAKYMGFYPLPNGPLLGKGDTGVFSFASQQVTNEDFVTTRVDHRFSEKDSLFGTYVYDRALFSTPDNLNTELLGNATRRQMAILEETHIFSPAVVNSLRFGINRNVAVNNQSVQAILPLAADKSLGAVPGRDAAQLTVPGLSSFSGGLDGSAAYFFHFTTIQAYDDTFYTRGLHSLKFGFAFERERNNILAVTNPNGVFNFGSLSDFLTNRPQQFQLGFANSLTPRGLRQTILGGYIQDDWRWHRNLTINLGLRYEMATVPTEVQGKLSTLRQITDAAPHLGDPYFANPTLKNWEPRAGLSWDPLGDGKTAVRAGFGMYDVLPLLYEFELLSSLAAPYYLNGNVSNPPPGSFPTGAASLLGVASLAQAYIDPNPRRNYILQWNFNIQRSVTPNLIATIGYVGSRGVHQPFRSDDIDIVMPTPTPQGYLWPSPAGSGKTINPNAGTIRGLFWDGNSFYDALQLQIDKRMSHGFKVQGSYTWGKSIDTSSSTLVGNAFANAYNAPFWFDTRLGRARSDFDIRRVLVLNALWEIPGPKTVPAPAQAALNGWEFGGIFKTADGIPFSALMAGDPLGLNSSALVAFPNRLTGPGCDSLVNPGVTSGYIKTQCFAFPSPSTLLGNSGRNIMTGPGLADLDFSIYKNTRVRRISETFNTQFRAEFFNIMNHANFAPPLNNLKLFDARGGRVSGAGLLDSTVTTSRQIQLALKVIW